MFCQTFEEGHEVAHYYGHENIGTYILLCKCGYGHHYDFYRFINYHMAAYTQHGQKWNTIVRYSSDEFIQNLLLLHEGDVKAHE